MYQRFFKYAAKSALQQHTCKGIFKVEINDYNEIVNDTYLCIVAGSIFYYYDNVQEAIIDYIPLNIVEIEICSDSSISLQILDDTKGQNIYCIKLFIVRENIRELWLKSFVQGGAKYKPGKRRDDNRIAEELTKKIGGRNSIIIDNDYKNTMILQGFCDTYHIEANKATGNNNNKNNNTDSKDDHHLIGYKERYKQSELEDLSFIVESVESVKLHDFVRMGESPEFQAKVDSLYDEAFVEKYVLSHIVETCNKYFSAADIHVEGAKEFVKKLYEIPLLFQDGVDALEEHKHRKHLQNGMLTETLHREKKGILGLKGLTRTGSNLKNITKKKGGLFSKIQTGTQSDHHRENTGMEANLKHQKHFQKITNSLNFLTSTLDNSFAHVNAMIKQQKLLLEPLAKMATNNYHELIGVLDIYGKKHEKHAKLRRQYQRRKGGDNVEVVAAAKELHAARVNLALKIGQYSQQKHVSYLQLVNRFALLNEQCIRSIYDSFSNDNVSNYIRKIFLSIQNANEDLQESVETSAALFRESMLTKQGTAEEQSTYRKTNTGMVGYLNKRSKTWKSKWMRRWFHVEGKSFFYTKGEKQFDRLQEFDLTLASVRPARNVNRDFCFELISSAPGGGMRIMVLQASNKIEYDAWMQAVMDAIMGALDHVTPTGAMDANVNIENSKRHLKARERQIETLSSAPGNLTCCECGTTKDVEWLSLNLGVVFCLDCAGIHRSLGVHVSQCRSFKLDVLDDSILSCFASLGNEKANSVWEGNCTRSDIVKPRPGTPRKEKEKWIRAKYVDKAFLPDEPVSNLVDAAAADDMTNVLRCIARGDDLNKINEWGATALGAAAHLGKLNPMTLLLLNGCNVNTCSPGAKWTPLHAAAYGGIVDAVRILVAKGADVDAKEKHGDSPLDIAIKYEHFDCVEVMGGLLSEMVPPKPIRKSVVGNKIPPAPIRKPPAPKRRPPTRKNSWHAAAKNSGRRRSARHTVSS